MERLTTIRNRELTMRVNWSHLAVSLVTSAWYVGFLGRCLTAGLVANSSVVDFIQGTCRIAPLWYCANPRAPLEFIRWVFVVLGLFTLLSSLAFVPIAFEKLDSWERTDLSTPDDFDDAIADCRSAIVAILASAGLFIFTPLASTVLAGITLQDRVLTVFTLPLLMGLRFWRFYQAMSVRDGDNERTRWELLGNHLRLRLRQTIRNRRRTLVDRVSVIALLSVQRVKALWVWLTSQLAEIATRWRRPPSGELGGTEDVGQPKSSV